MTDKVNYFIFNEQCILHMNSADDTELRIITILRLNFAKYSVKEKCLKNF